MKIKIIVVKGTGRFPIDMLRYDQCWPATEADAVSIEASQHDYMFREVKLKAIYRWAGPTDARWRSFGWRVDSVDGRKW